MRNYLIVNWGKLLLWLMPPILRKQRHYIWLMALLKPLQTLYEKTLFQMQHNGQVIYLEKVLNETFNPTVSYDPNLNTQQKQAAEYIYIDESLRPTIQFVYKHEEYYLHTLEEHINIPVSDSMSGDMTGGEIILDELNSLDPIELFTCEELKVNDTMGDSSSDMNVDNTVSNNMTGDNVVNSFTPYPTFLSSARDFTDELYANFRIMIPQDLSIEIADNRDGISNVLDFMPFQNETTQLYYRTSANSRGANNSIEIITSRFHQVVNFYKLAGKTYETFRYGQDAIALQQNAESLRICNPETQISSILFP